MNLNMAPTGTQNGVTPFLVGYHQFHPDVSLNFQMNRFSTRVGETRQGCAGLLQPGQCDVNRVSLGGYFVIPAVAYESRVHRVIADDVLADFFEVLLQQMKPAMHPLLRALLINRAVHQMNALFERAMKGSLMIEKGTKQGMHVTGSQTPYVFLQKIRLYQTRPFSSHVSQDVLLMTGSEDHSVPFHQFSDQIATFKNVRSLTARLFTRWE